MILSTREPVSSCQRSLVGEKPQIPCVGEDLSNGKRKNITKQKPKREPSMNSIVSVPAVVSVIPLKRPRENFETVVTPGWRVDIVRLTSQDYWPVAPVAIGAGRAGDLIPPFPDTSGAGDGVTVTEPGVMIVRPLRLGTAFIGTV